MKRGRSSAVDATPAASKTRSPSKQPTASKTRSTSKQQAASKTRSPSKGTASMVDADDMSSDNDMVDATPPRASKAPSRARASSSKAPSKQPASSSKGKAAMVEADDNDMVDATPPRASSSKAPSRARVSSSKAPASKAQKLKMPALSVAQLQPKSGLPLYAEFLKMLAIQNLSSSITSELGVEETIALDNDVVVFQGTKYRPVARIGNQTHHRALCLLVTSASERGGTHLTVIFRPFLIFDNNDMTWADTRSSTSQWFGSFIGTAEPPYTDDRASHVYTAARVFDRKEIISPLETEPRFNVARGDVELLNTLMYEVTTKDIRLDDRSEMIPAIQQAVEQLNPTEVTFVGFSLGSQLSASASVMLGPWLKARKPSTTINVFAFSGEPRCTLDSAAYIEQNFAKHYSLVVDGDTVSKLNGFFHFEDMYMLSFMQQTITKITNNEIDKRKLTDTMAAQSIPLSTTAQNFQKVHLPAIDMWMAVLLSHILDAEPTPIRLFRLGMILSSTPSMLCSWFNTHGPVKKYKVCPVLNRCIIDTYTEGGKKLTECLEKKLEYAAKVPMRSISRQKNTGVGEEEETELLNALNNQRIRKTILESVTKKLNDSEFSYRGNIVIKNEMKYNEKKKEWEKINGIVRIVKEDEGVVVFSCSTVDGTGCIYFIHDKMNRQTVYFKPFGGFDSKETLDIVMKDWDDEGEPVGIAGNGIGIISSMFRKEIFSPAGVPQFRQAWSLLWVCNYLSECNVAGWSEDPIILTNAIHTYMLWLASKFKLLTPSKIEVLSTRYGMAIPDKGDGCVICDE
jgi:hypothetical protein